MSAETKKVEEMNYFELLAWLGIGSSHPGGFLATRQNINSLQLNSEDYILDAGCGSGLTACYIAKTAGCKVMGIDISNEMIEKARLRAEREGVTHLVSFKAADVNHLPFKDNSFDWVIGESITVFLDKVKVYREFHRVLKPEGRVADLEMALLRDMPPIIKAQMKECFGQSTDPLTLDGWCNALTEAGFIDVDIKNAQPLGNRSNILLNELKNDWLLVMDLKDKFMAQPGLIPRLRKNANFVKQNLVFFGFGVIYGIKPIPPKLGFKDRLLRFLSGKTLSNPGKVIDSAKNKINKLMRTNNKHLQ